MTKLHDLHREQGQSPWIDNLTRQAITTGGLARMRDDGARDVGQSERSHEVHSAHDAGDRRHERPRRSVDGWNTASRVTVAAPSCSYLSFRELSTRALGNPASARAGDAVRRQAIGECFDAPERA